MSARKDERKEQEESDKRLRKYLKSMGSFEVEEFERTKESKNATKH